jgi:hypothetical protein
MLRQVSSPRSRRKADALTGATWESITYCFLWIPNHVRNDKIGLIFRFYTSSVGDPRRRPRLTKWVTLNDKIPQGFTLVDR